MGRIIAIANQKGGVGKTTTAVNLAASLGAAEVRTLLIDIDPQANASSGAGVGQAEGDDKQIYHVLLGEASIAESAVKSDVPNLDIVRAGADLIGFEVEGLELEEREKKLAQALVSVKEKYDVVLIDCPPSLGLITLNALCAADGVLVPLQCEYYAMEGLGRLLKTLELVRNRLNPGLELSGIVLTMFDRRNNLSHQVASEVGKHFGESLWTTRIPRNVRLSEAPSFGQPILTYDIRSVGAQTYLSLADEFVKRVLRISTRTMEETQTQLKEKRSENERTESPGSGDRLPHSKPESSHV